MFSTENIGFIHMGRIKSTLVKRTAMNLLKEDNKFTEDYKANNELLKNSMPSKSTRNKITGYIARLKRMEREKRAIVETH